MPLSSSTADVPPDSPLVGLGIATRRVVALAGNPNTGKSTLFNSLTGLRQKVANFPGITVDTHIGSFPTDGPWIEVLDLPGIYSLAAHSPDERLALDVLLGREDGPKPEAVVVVADASNLERNLFIAYQILELGMPVVLALTMLDVAEDQGLTIDRELLEERLGVPVIDATAKRYPVDGLRMAVAKAIDGARVAEIQPPMPQIREASQKLAAELGSEVTQFDVERALIDEGGASVTRLQALGGQQAEGKIEALREALTKDVTLAEREAIARYGWAEDLLAGVEQQHQEPKDPGPLDRFLDNSVTGSLVFFAVMTIMFQAVFAWATPLMDAIDRATSALSGVVASWLPEGLFASFLTDGLIAGVGAVVIFLPQILILFAFILVLEDSGYMARAAFLIDRLMKACGLSGQSFVPMLSSFACAVPGIMATRVIPSRRDRLATILAAPFMTCSARLPVYALLIAAVVPNQRVLPFINLQGLVLLGLYLFGIVGGVLTALLLKRTALRGPAPPFLLEMPPLRQPQLRSIAVRLFDRARMFLWRAGTIIFAVSVLVWILATFPRSPQVAESFAIQRAQAASQSSGPELESLLADVEAREAAAQLEASALGRAGKLVEPIFRPLGWDWRISSAVIASFPAREVIVATLGTIYALGDVDDEDQRLITRIQAATWPDGQKIFTTPVAVGLMLFFALCLQCGATVAVIKRESGGWRWPIFAWCYMTGLAYLSALAAYQIGTHLGF